MKSFTVRALTLSLCTTFIAACGAKLLWQSSETLGQPAVATAVAVDADKNSYVGIGLRSASAESINDGYSPSLEKRDDKGQLIWRVSLTENYVVKQVVALGNSLLAVATGGSATVPGARGELLLVSSVDGSIVRVLQSYSDRKFVKMLVGNNSLVVASSSQDYTCKPSSCDHFDTAVSAIDVYSTSGDVLKSTLLKTSEIVDFDVDNQRLTVLEQSPALKIESFDYALSKLTSTDDVAESKTVLASCAVDKLEVSNGSAFVLCEKELVKFNPQAQVVWRSRFDAFLKTKTNWGPGIDAIDYWAPNAVMSADAAGNIVVAKTRAKALASRNEPPFFGPVPIPGGGVFQSDVVLLKLDGATGTVVWSDDINTSPAVSDSSVTAIYYQPVEVNAQGSRIHLTYRAAVAEIKQCYEWADMFLPLSPCEIDNYKDQYGATREYATDGKRLSVMRHAIKKPRAVVEYGGTQWVVGDEETLLSASDADFYVGGIAYSHDNLPEDFLTPKPVSVQAYQYK